MKSQDILTRFEELIERPGYHTTWEAKQEIFNNLKVFDSRAPQDVDRLLILLELAGERKSLSRHASQLMRDLGSKMDYLNENQMQRWLRICLANVQACTHEHERRLDQDVEWYHESLNSLCGDSTDAGILPLLLREEPWILKLRSNFLNEINKTLKSKIDLGGKRHAEVITAALAKYSLWLEKDPTHEWFMDFALRAFEDPSSEKFRAFWQGFLSIRKWNLELLRSIGLDIEVQKTLELFPDLGLKLGADSERSMILLLVEFYLRTPVDEQLTDFFESFINRNYKSELFRQWVTFTGFALQDIDFDANPDLADIFYLQRYLPLLNTLKRLDISPKVVGAALEASIAFNYEFESCVQNVSLLAESKGCSITGPSRILVLLDDDKYNGRLFTQHPRPLCQLLNLIVGYSVGNVEFEDWVLSNLVEKYGKIMLQRAPLEVRILLTSCKRKKFSLTLGIANNVLGPISNV